MTSKSIMCIFWIVSAHILTKNTPQNIKDELLKDDASSGRDSYFDDDERFRLIDLRRAPLHNKWLAKRSPPLSEENSYINSNISFQKEPSESPKQLSFDHGRSELSNKNEKLNLKVDTPLSQLYTLHKLSHLDLDSYEYSLNSEYLRSSAGFNILLYDCFFQNPYLERINALISEFESKVRETLQTLNTLKNQLSAFHHFIERDSKLISKLFLLKKDIQIKWEATAPNINSFFKSGSGDGAIEVEDETLIAVRMEYISIVRRFKHNLHFYKDNDKFNTLEKGLAKALASFNTFKRKNVCYLLKVWYRRKVNCLSNLVRIRENKGRKCNKENTIEINFDLKKEIEKVKLYYKMVKIEIQRITVYLYKGVLEINDRKNKNLEELKKIIE